MVECVADRGFTKVFRGYSEDNGQHDERICLDEAGVVRITGVPEEDLPDGLLGCCPLFLQLLFLVDLIVFLYSKILIPGSPGCLQERTSNGKTVALMGHICM